MATIELLRVKSGEVFKTTTYTGPHNWSEMEKKHLIIWAATMASQVEEHLASEIMAAQLFSIPIDIFQNLIKAKDKVRLALSVGFLLKRNKLTNWLIPSFWNRFTKYYGPKSKLMNISAKEFGLLEHCYTRFAQTKNEDYLNHLAAILYRPRKYWGITDDIRRPLYDHSLEKRAEKFAKLPLAIKWAIYLNYEGCRNFIHDNNPEVFKRSSSNAPSKSANQWGLVINAAAGGKFGTLTQTEDSNIHKFLLELNERIKNIKSNA